MHTHTWYSCRHGISLYVKYMISWTVPPGLSRFVVHWRGGDDDNDNDNAYVLQRRGDLQPQHPYRHPLGMPSYAP
jgi:hypothetical protein